MACVLTTGYKLNCKGTGGVTKIYIGKYDGAAGLTYDTNGNLTDIGNTENYYLFEQPVNSAEFKVTVESSTENNTVGYKQSLEMVLNDLDATTVAKINVLVRGVWTVFIVDKDGNIYAMGVDSPAMVSAGEGGTGKNLNDLKGLKLTFESVGKVPVTNVIPSTTLQSRFVV